MVEPTTIGAASCPLSMDVEKLHASFNWPAFAGVISDSGLYRVLA